VPTTLVAGKYRLTRLLGRGGMGSVWEGVHETLGTRVAVKRIEVENAESAAVRKRFENEARAAAKLQSKHVVEVYDYGVGADGHPFIVMQYLEGEALDKRLLRVGRLPAAETARIVVQICRALSRAHSLGIIHRDLKPDNVFLVRDDEDGSEVVKVVDFGIAKMVDAPPEESATNTGNVVGTPYYMSPEQARGLKTLDQRSDLWSVGVIAFRCMVGRLPFRGDAVGDVLVNLCTGPIPIPSEIVVDLPSGFDNWILRALSRLPSERFPTAQELGDELAVICSVSARVSPISRDIPIVGSDTLGEIAYRATDQAPSEDTSPTELAPRDQLSPSLVSPELTHAGTANTKGPSPGRRVPALLAAAGLFGFLVAVVFGQSRSGSAPLGKTAGAPSASPAPATSLAPAAPPARIEAPSARPPDAVLPAPEASSGSAPAGSAARGHRPGGSARAPTATRHGTPPASASAPSLEIRLER